jgi:hypothetical protein
MRVASIRASAPPALRATCPITRKPPTQTMRPPGSRKTVQPATAPRRGRAPRSTTLRPSSLLQADTRAFSARAATREAFTQASAPLASRATCPITRRPPIPTTRLRASRSSAMSAIRLQPGHRRRSTMAPRGLRSRGDTRRSPAPVATSAASTRARLRIATPATRRRTAPPRTRTIPRQDSPPPAKPATRPRDGRGHPSATPGSRVRTDPRKPAATATPTLPITPFLSAPVAMPRRLRIRIIRGELATSTTARTATSVTGKGAEDRR